MQLIFQRVFAAHPSQQLLQLAVTIVFAAN